MSRLVRHSSAPAAIALMVALVGLGGCRRETAATTAHDGPTLATAALRSSILIDPDYLYPGSVLCSRDVAYLEQEYARRLGRAGVGGPMAARLRATEELLGAARRAGRQATRFVFECDGVGVRLRPLDWSPNIRPTAEVRADVVVVGGELSSLCAAVAAADRGFGVAVVCAGPLGGLSSDQGANLRFFDCIAPTSHPACQREVWRQGLHAPTWVSLPPDTDARLAAYLARAYGRRIRLLRTSSYDSLHVDREGDVVRDIETTEGVRIVGRAYLDMDPESRVAEKAGLPMDVTTPHMSCGVVFDVDGMGPAEWRALRSHDRLDPEELMALAGVSPQQVLADPAAAYSERVLAKRLRRDTFNESGPYAFGYEALAWGFDFWMRCRGLAEPHNADLRWLNDRRCVSGFNIARWGRTGTFNSLSYRLRKTVLQHAHNLYRDPDYRPLRDVEMPALTEYLRRVAGSHRLVVRMPPQFYVRTSTAFFPVVHPYRAAEFGGRRRGPYYTTYPMDLRDLSPRDPDSWAVVQRYVRAARGKHFWNCRASATQTAIANLYLVNKCAVTPAYSGGQRVEQNQINMAAALVASLPRP